MRKGFLIQLARVCAVGAFALGLAWLLFQAFPLILDAPTWCDKPCGLSLRDYPSLELNCKPASLTLELFKLEAKVGVRYPLWYRATLRNETCFSMKAVFAHSLIKGLEFQISDSGGREVSISTRSVWNDIIPYRYSPVAFEELKKRPELNFTIASGPDMDHFYFDLMPGASVQTLPAVLLPRLNWLQPHMGPEIDTSLMNPAFRKLIASRVQGKSFAEPPPGFSPVDGYIFRKPGRYRIEAKLSTGFYQELLYPRLRWYLENVPESVRKMIEWPYAKLMNEQFYVPKPSETRYELNVRSNSVEFEVIE